MFTSGFLAVVILAAIHFFAGQLQRMGWLWHGKFLSFAAGISFAYVFVDLLPKLEEEQAVLKGAWGLDKHVYVIALIGVLFYYGLHAYSRKDQARNFWMVLWGYVLFNFFVGTSLADSNNPEIQPLYLFVAAMGMHYFVHDHNLSEQTEIYQDSGRWCLVGALFLGYFVGYAARIPDYVEAVLVAFVSGGVLLNSLGYELPKRDQLTYGAFVLGSLVYTALLLSIGNAF